jgi:hypothetical protein
MIGFSEKAKKTYNWRIYLYQLIRTVQYYVIPSKYGTLLGVTRQYLMLIVEQVKTVKALPDGHLIVDAFLLEA